MIRRVPCPAVLALVPFLVTVSVATAQTNGSTGTLFTSYDVLELQLVTDLNKLINDDNAKRDGDLSYAGPGGDSVTLKLKVLTARRDVDVSVGMRAPKTVYLQQSGKICDFPPFQLDLEDSKTDGTIFSSHVALKLITHCEDDEDDAEQWAVQQYLMHRTLALVSDWCLQARLVRVTYIDQKNKRDPMTKYAVLIEDPQHMASRIGGQLYDVQGLHPLDIDSESMVTMALFQFMVFNTDWGVSGLHNVKIVAYQNVAYPVPYNFEWSGIVNAPFAKPSDALSISTVRDRLYRGFCRPDFEFEAPLARFNSQRESILEMVRTEEGLEPEVRARMVSDYEEFYQIVNDPDGWRNWIMVKCREDSRG